MIFVSFLFERLQIVCYLEAPEEPEEADSTLGEDSCVMSVQGMTPNDSKHLQTMSKPRACGYSLDLLLDSPEK